MSAKGFTLIETLVVVSIIGILIALSTVGLRGAQSSARDAQRKTDLQDIRSALEIYKSDCGTYPPASALNFGTGSLSGTCNGSANVYMSKVPQDPQYSSKDYIYEYVPSSNNKTYTLCSTLENNNAAGTVCGGYATGTCKSGSSSQSCKYSVINP